LIEGKYWENTGAKSVEKTIGELTATGGVKVKLTGQIAFWVELEPEHPKYFHIWQAF
jgi:hypothetical protein